MAGTPAKKKKVVAFNAGQAIDGGGSDAGAGNDRSVAPGPIETPDGKNIGYTPGEPVPWTGTNIGYTPGKAVLPEPTWQDAPSQYIDSAFQGRYLQDEEKTLYSQKNIDALNAAQDTAAIQEQSGLQPKFAARGYAAPSPLTQVQSLNTASGQVIPLHALKTDQDRSDFVVTNYPTLATSALQAGLSNQETKDAINFTMAYDAAQRIGTSQNPARQQQLMASMSNPMQSLVYDIIQAKIAEQKKLQDDSTGNPLMDVAKTAWNWSGGPIINALVALNEGTMRDIRATTQVMSNASEDGMGGLSVFNPMAWKDAWDQVAHGYHDPEYVAFLEGQYGKKEVNIVLEIQAAHRSGEQDALGHILTKYKDDSEALDIIDNAINGVHTGENTAEMITAIDAGDQGNMGNYYNQAMGEALGLIGSPTSASAQKFYQTPTYKALSTVQNLVYPVVLDPTLAAGKIRAGYLSARYGLHLLAEGRTAEVFARPTVQRFFDTLGKSISRIDDLDNGGDVGAAAQLRASLNSSYKHWFNAEGIESLRLAKVTDAASAERFFTEAEHVNLLMVGQSARRLVQVPHMTIAAAVAKQTSLAVRGMTYASMGPAYLDAIIPGLSHMVPAEAQSALAARLAGPDGAKEVARLVNDFTYGANGEGVRTLAGKVADSIPGLGRKVDEINATSGRVSNAMSRYGWKRPVSFSALQGRAERLFAIYPDASRPLRTVDGSDADRVRQLMQLSGTSRYWSNYVAHIWREGDQATRVELATGLGRMYGYARGIDLVDPQDGKRIIDNLMRNSSDGANYTPSMQDLTSLRGQAAAQAKASVNPAHLKTPVAEGEPLPQGMSPELAAIHQKRVDLGTLIAWRDEARVERATAEVRTALAADIKRHRAELKSMVDKHVRLTTNDVLRGLKENAPITNPSRMGETTTAIYESDLTDHVAFPNLYSVDRITARSSYLNMLLGTNAGVTKMTDLWVLGTLAGPRFQVRAGIEDSVFYALTGGGIGGFNKGRKVGTAVREATQRAEASLTHEARGMKLGILKTLTRDMGDLLPEGQASFILPHLSSAEIGAAHLMAAEGNRAALAALVQKAYLRQRLGFLYDTDRFKLASKGGELFELNTKQLNDLRYIDDAIQHGDVLRSMDEVAETGQHLADGSLAARQYNPETYVIDGVEVHTERIGTHYVTRAVHANDPDTVKAWYLELQKVMHGDGVKGLKAMGLLRRYNRSVMAGDSDATHAIVQELADVLALDPKYAERWAIVSKGGSSGLFDLSERTLQNMNRMFTNRNGAFNMDLYNKVARDVLDEQGNVIGKSYAVWDKGSDGLREYRLTQTDLAEMKNVPQTVNVIDGLMVPVNDKLPLTGRIWGAMGRSLARMTREPIFMSNYLDARATLSVFETRLAEKMGSEAATKWAVDTATERAYAMSMDYMDNPLIRSQMAWNLRNVGRFYRALEDFNRRMMRLTRNNPMGIWKAALGWNILDTSGQTWSDEYGQKYFVWPGTRPLFEAMNGIMNLLGGPELVSPGLPLAFSSKVNMLTPSADPNSWMPTFSGPFMAVPLKGFMDQFPQLKSLETAMLGTYAEDNSLLGVALPPNIVRLVSFAQALLQPGAESHLAASEGLYASSARSAIQAYAAAGLFDASKQHSEADIALMRERIDMTSMWILGMKVLMGPIIPAATSLDVQSTTEFGRSLGLDSVRPEFMQLVRANNGDMDEATKIWLRMNPDLSPFTVSTTEMPGDAGYMPSTQEALKFVEANPDLVNNNMIGASFFAPQVGTSTLQAYSSLKSMGFRRNAAVETYFKKILVSQGMTEYNALQNERDQSIADGTDKKLADEAFAEAKAELVARIPDIPSALSGSLQVSSSKVAEDYRSDVDSVRDAIAYFEKKGKLSARDQAMKDILQATDEARTFLRTVDVHDPHSADSIAAGKDGWMDAVSPAALGYLDDKQLQYFIGICAKSLNIKVE